MFKNAFDKYRHNIYNCSCNFIFHTENEMHAFLSSMYGKHSAWEMQKRGAVLSLKYIESIKMSIKFASV